MEHGTKTTETICKTQNYSRIMIINLCLTFYLAFLFFFTFFPPSFYETVKFLCIFFCNDFILFLFIYLIFCLVMFRCGLFSILRYVVRIRCLLFIQLNLILLFIRRISLNNLNIICIIYVYLCMFVW